MSLFSHRTHASPKANASLPASNWQRRIGAHQRTRTAAIPPWLINTASLIVMVFLVALSLSIGVADFSWSGILQSIISITLIFLCYTSERFKINLEEFPQKVPEK
mgnify:CR=1 FL=1